MSKLAAVTLVALTVFGVILATVSQVEAKGPPGKVTISGGNLRTAVVIERPDLVPIDEVGYFDSGGISYARTPHLASELSYHVDVYMLEPNTTEPQRFLSSSYFPPTASHPALLSDDDGVWKAQSVFAALLDSHIQAAVSPAKLPSAGGPPDTMTNTWVYLMSLGALLLLGSAAALGYYRRR